MSEWCGRWKQTTIAAALVTGGLLLGTHSAAASTIGITNQSGILNIGHVDFGILGGSFDPVADPFTTPVPGIAGLTITGAQVGGGEFIRIDQGPIDWNGNFGAGEKLLWSFFSGPMTFAFNAPIAGFGAQIAADSLGAYSARIEAFDAGNISLGFFSANGTATSVGNDSALFLGILSSSANIRRISIGLTSSTGDLGDFAINSPSIQDTPIPEPASLLLLGTGIIAGARRARRRA